MKLQQLMEANRVIIIDDSQKDGEELRKALDGANISSLFLYNDSKVILPESSCPNVRLVFLDLDMNPSIVGSRDKAVHALAVLKKVIGSQRFYMLIVLV